jgi:serine/threonine protein kinase
LPAKDAFAGYRFHKVLGDGSAGRFEATESASGEKVVIESLVGDAATDADAREWFAWAWDALSGIEHANLPQVRAVGEAGEAPFAVREPIDGRPLSALLEAEERVEPAGMRVLICRMADGLHRAHEAGVIHGALGPADLIVEPEARGGPGGRWIGFGRAEGLRREDIAALGDILNKLLVAERATRPQAEAAEDDGPSMDEAIVAMLGRVAAAARNGDYRTAAEFRDEVAAGTEQPRGWRRFTGMLRGG